MAAVIGTNVHIHRTVFSLQNRLNITRLSWLVHSKAQLHTSVPKRGRVLRRRPLQVIMQDGSDSGKANVTVRPPKSYYDPASGVGLYSDSDKVTASRVRIRGEPPSDTYFTRRLSNTDDGDKLQEWSEHGAVSTSEQQQKVKYNKVTVTDKRFGKLMALAKNRKMRDRSNKVVLEGYRLVRDALLAGARAHTIFFTLLSNIEGLPINKKETELVMVPYKEFQLWSDLSTPQGILGVFSKPTIEVIAKDGTDSSIPLTLICDNVRDPGNLGTILRAAAAANCEKIVVAKGCVDIWDPKVLRAGAGAHFHVPIIRRATWSEMSNYIDPNTALYVADTFKYENMGKEHRTLSQIPYSDLDWTMQSALVIGGETEGISKDAFDLCQKTDGMSLFIPMSEGIDSLNAAMSATVMLFEAKRQWVIHQKTKR